jgi:hypothetical protein
MAEFGWAYIDCEEDTSGSALGPTGSIQFHHAGTSITGSDYLVFHTSSSPFELRLTGSLTVSGTITADIMNINVTNENVINLSASGDTKFGDSFDDSHEYTGSLFISGGLNVNYYKLTDNSYIVNSTDYIIGVSSSAYVSITLPAYNSFSGKMLIIKDEWNFSGSARPSIHPIGLTASTGFLDGNGNYEISNGDFAAVTLYSDGVVGWFVV